ncbi:hypothetical protein [Desulfoferrobacter suflitae]|uniref:hypothetical protein n=1 Tax=Desulfoferrobacter suflitae TaxID=2865782 RepID=UPI0021643A42|nr:hypothetical protein [Desulfoferrobacter suflitae]MCK8600111.1 hypothetical protein [Desulfoferrobacter suflitae]
MKQKDENSPCSGAISPPRFDEVEPESIQGFSQRDLSKGDVFMDVPASALLSTLRRAKRYRTGGFDALARKDCHDRGHARPHPQKSLQPPSSLNASSPSALPLSTDS